MEKGGVNHRLFGNRLVAAPAGLELTGETALVLQPEQPVCWLLGLAPLQLWRCFRLIESTRAALERNANHAGFLEALLFGLALLKPRRW